MLAGTPHFRATGVDAAIFVPPTPSADCQGPARVSDARPTVHAESTTELEFPRYRVNFWQHISGGCALDADVLEGAADYQDALAWIETNSNGRIYELFVETDETEERAGFSAPRKSSLVRLAGSNPNADAAARLITSFERVDASENGDPAETGPELG